MCECKAWGCTNNKRKNPDKHYFCVPKPNTEEKKIRVQQWLDNLGTGHSIETFKFGRNSVVCIDHFEEKYIKRDLMSELLGLKRKYRLTEDAVPTLVNLSAKPTKGCRKKLKEHKPVEDDKTNIVQTDSGFDDKITGSDSKSDEGKFLQEEIKIEKVHDQEWSQSEMMSGTGDVSAEVMPESSGQPIAESGPEITPELNDQTSEQITVSENPDCEESVSSENNELETGGADNQESEQASADSAGLDECHKEQQPDDSSEAAVTDKQDLGSDELDDRDKNDLEQEKADISETRTENESVHAEPDLAEGPASVSGSPDSVQVDSEEMEEKFEKNSCSNTDENEAKEMSEENSTDKMSGVENANKDSDEKEQTDEASAQKNTSDVGKDVDEKEVAEEQKKDTESEEEAVMSEETDIKDEESAQNKENDADAVEGKDTSEEKQENSENDVSEQDMETEASVDASSKEEHKSLEKSSEADQNNGDQPTADEMDLDESGKDKDEKEENDAAMEVDKADSGEETAGAGGSEVTEEKDEKETGERNDENEKEEVEEDAKNEMAGSDCETKSTVNASESEGKHDSDVSTAKEEEKTSKSAKGEEDDLVLIEDDKPEAIIVDDDDESSENKNRLSNGILNTGNDMGLQIASVSGRVEMPDDDKNKDGTQIKEEPKTVPEKKLPEKKGSSGACQKTSKSQTCIVCRKIGRCKYNIVRNGDTKHLCDDVCFRHFRANPTQFLKGAPAATTTTTTTASTTVSHTTIKSPTTRSRTGSLPASSPRTYREEPDIPVIDSPAPASQTTAPAAAAPPPLSAAIIPPPAPAVASNDPASQYKTCSVCQLMNINTQKPFINWQGFDFCGESCLSKYQATLSSSCAYCATFIPANSRVLHPTKVGNEVRLLCTSKCLSEFKKRLRLCAFCQTDLSGCPDSFSAPIGPQTFREFCSQACLKKFEDKNNDVEIIGFETSKPKTAAKCSVCHKITTVKHNIKLNGVLNRLCSDPCLSAFQYTNKLAMNTCDNCGGLCPTEETVSHFIQFEGQQKRFCKDTCVNAFRTINRKIVPCAWCGTKKPNFDMIERVDSNNKYQLFCSLNCLSLYRVNLQAKSNQSVSCDYCHKFVPAQYHLTMSDASVRNFCSYNCVMVFQSQFSANKSSSQPTIHSQPTKIQLQQKPTVRGNENTSVMNTRRRQASQNTNQQASFPIISNVVSLAPQSSQKGQTVNIKTTSAVPVIVSGQSQTIRVGAKTVTAGTGMQQATTTQQIIIQPPPPKQMKNKSLLCKPCVQTKATSCRPHVQTKEVQTDGEGGKPILIPVPIPIYIPTPLAMYTSPVPQFIPIPIPIPIPIFIPTTKKSAAKILKQIKKIREKIPADPLEAELLQMAQAVAGGDNDSDSDSDHSDTEEKPDEVEEEKIVAHQNDIDILENQIDRSGGEEDLVQMALRMAEEITGPVLDLESNVQLVAVNSEPTQVVQVPRPPVQDDDNDDDWVPSRETRARRGKRSSTGSGRGRGRQAKKPRVETYREPTPEPSPPPVQQPPADANMHLKFTYGVNAWKHWVIHKNTLLEKVSKRGSGKLKLFKTDLLQCTADELNYSLCLFVKEVRKPNGEEYSPDSIYYLCLGIQQYLYENSRIDNIFTDFYYEKFTECLTEMLSKHQPKVNAAGQMLCRIEEEHLWECKQLGAHSPYVLLNTLIYFNTKHFMLKTIDDHMKLSFAHILKHWKKGVPPTSTRTPMNQVGRSVSLRYYYGPTNNKKPKEGIPVYETSENLENPLRCPVKLYEFYLSKAVNIGAKGADTFVTSPARSRPESIKNRNDLFYLLPERSCVPDSPVWYSTQSIPVETMSKMLCRILLVREIQEAHLHAQPVYV